MTMDGKTEPTMDALPGEGQPSGGDVSPSEETYSSEQVKVFLSERHSTLDSQISTLSKDLKESQATVETKDTELSNAAQENQSLQSQLEELTSGDPKKFDVIKREGKLREGERILLTGTQVLAADIEANKAKNKLSDDTLREIAINQIAAGYEGGDATGLKNAVEKLEKDFGITIKSEDQIKMAIPSTWAKKAPETLVTLSGKTSGGAENLTTPAAKVTRALAKLAKT